MRYAICNMHRNELSWLECIDILCLVSTIIVNHFDLLVIENRSIQWMKSLAKIVNHDDVISVAKSIMVISTLHTSHKTTIDVELNDFNGFIFHVVMDWMIGMFASQQGQRTHSTFDSPTDAKYSMTRFRTTIEQPSKEQRTKKKFPTVIEFHAASEKRRNSKKEIVGNKTKLMEKLSVFNDSTLFT